MLLFAPCGPCCFRKVLACLRVHARTRVKRGREVGGRQGGEHTRSPVIFRSGARLGKLFLPVFFFGAAFLPAPPGETASPFLVA